MFSPGAGAVCSTSVVLSRGLVVGYGGSLDFAEGVVDNFYFPAQMDQCTVILRDAEFLNCATYGVSARFSSRIDANSLVVNLNSSQAAFSAGEGATVNLDSAAITNTGTGGYALYAWKGAQVNFNDGTAANSDGTLDDIVVEKGAVINAVGATGTLSKTSNTITSDGLIIQ